YADIFYNNCFKNGILPIKLSEEQVDQLFKNTEAEEGYALTIDLEAQTVSDSKGLEISFEVDPYRKECLLKGLDDIAISLEFDDQIQAYEAKYPSYYLIK